MSTLPVRPQIRFRRIAGAWTISAAGSLSVNLVLYWVAHVVLAVPDRFQPLSGPVFVAAYTLLGTLGAALTLVLLTVINRCSLTVFRWSLAVAVFVLTLSAFILGTVAPIPILAVVGLAAGAVFLSLAGHLWRRPLRAFQTVAGFMLLVSFVPDLSLLVGPAADRVARVWGPTPELVATLVAMHLCTALITIGTLTAFLRAREEVSAWSAA